MTLLNRYKDIFLEFGIDESGAGPAFGPVVAAAVLMPLIGLIIF